MTNYQQLLEKLNDHFKLKPPVYINESVFTEDDLKKLKEGLREQKGE